MSKKPLLTIFSINLEGKTFRVYDHVPPGRNSRFVIDDSVTWKTSFVSRKDWTEKLLYSFNKTTGYFKSVVEKVTKGITNFNPEYLDLLSKE